MPTAQIVKWGNSLAVRIPKPVAEEAADPVLIAGEASGSSRHNEGFRLSTRHPIIASIIFDSAAPDDRRKFIVINDIISELDPGYNEDRRLLEEIVRRKELVDTLARLEGAVELGVKALLDPEALRARLAHARGLDPEVGSGSAYLMWKHGWTRDEALAFIRTKRPEVRPNAAFMERLSDWENVLKRD